MRVLILCGGKGTRAYPQTETIPKALMSINGQPILAHVMSIYARQGFVDFVLSVGYLGNRIREFVQGRFPEWNVDVVDTGAEADTGERIYGCRDRLGETFLATYCDGLGPIDLDALLDFHRAHAGVATVTSTPLPSQYGTLVIDTAGRVADFREKPILQDYWINAGFFVFDHAVFDHWEGRNLEREVLPALAEKELLFTYRHDGFWKSMDTYKDCQELNRLWEERQAPWAV